MRSRLAAVAIAVTLVASCSGAQRPTEEPTQPDVAADTHDLPAAMQSFLDSIAAPGTVAFDATYDVTQKLGGKVTSIRVTGDPPRWRIEAPDVVVVDGPQPATCRPSTRRCVGDVREEQLTQFGVPTRFFSTNTARLLSAADRRAGAGAPVVSERAEAGVTLHCLGVPVGGGIAALACVTAEGVVGYEDDPSRTVVLTSYRAGAGGERIVAPFPLVDHL